MKKKLLLVQGLEKRISLKKLNYFMLFSAVVISAVLFFAMRETKLIAEEAHTVTQQLVESERESANLRVASDYLTEQIRLFVINGKKEFKSIEISPAAVDPDDIEMLQDLILSAVNEAVRTAEETMEKEVAKVTGGLGGNLGGFGF